MKYYPVASKELALMDSQIPVKIGTPVVLSVNLDKDFKAGDFVIVLDIVKCKLRVYSPSSKKDRLISLCRENGAIVHEFFPVQLAFAATAHSLQGEDFNCVPVFLRSNL